MGRGACGVRRGVGGRAGLSGFGLSGYSRALVWRRTWGVNRYEDLDVWRLAYQLTLELYADTRAFPADERYGLIAQLRRAAVSTVSSIAEGAGRRTTGEFRNLLSVASGSVAEVDCQLRLASDLGYIGAPTSRQRRMQWARVQQMIYRLDQSLNRPRE